MAKELGWDASRVAKEKEAALKYLTTAQVFDDHVCPASGS